MSVDERLDKSNHEESNAEWEGIGICKWFNVRKGWGFVSAEGDGTDIFVHQSALRMEGFRSLGEGELVTFIAKRSGKGWEALQVSGPDGSSCRGSDIRPLGRKNHKRIRCYNCGQLGTHLASHCKMPHNQKVCYNCRSTDHLIADCPSLPPDSLRLNNGHTINDAEGNNNNNNNHQEEHSPPLADTKAPSMSPPRQQGELTGDSVIGQLSLSTTNDGDEGHSVAIGNAVVLQPPLASGSSESAVLGNSSGIGSSASSDG